MTHRDDFIAWCNDTSESTAESDMLPVGARLPGPRPALIGDYVPVERSIIDTRHIAEALASLLPGVTWHVRRDPMRMEIQLVASRGQSSVQGRASDGDTAQRVMQSVAMEAERMFGLLGSGLTT